VRYALIVLAATLASAQTMPKASAVLNGASFSGNLCPGASASLFGSNLATDTSAAQSLPLPTNLLGTQVLVQDPSMLNPIIAPLYFVSPGQINFQIPFELVRMNVSISVSTPQGTSNAVNVTLGPMAPGIFSQTGDGAGTALAFDPNFKLLTATPDLGSTLILYATGLGATTPPASSGLGGSSSLPLNQVAGPFDVYIGGSKATVAWAGLAPGFAGVYQLNVVPSAAAVGDVVIVCGTCRESNHVKMPQAPLSNGDNTANVTGSVAILYPANQPTLTYSAAFVVAKLTAQFYIKPTAGRFTLSVTATIGSTAVDGTTLQFYPVEGDFSAIVPSPAASVRTGNFSQAGIKVLDFTGACGGGFCPFPDNIVPESRLDPALLSALGSVSLPNLAPNGIHSFYDVTIEAEPGSTFTLGGSTNVDVMAFASFTSIPYPTSDVPVSVTLYIDGQVVDAATTTYKPPQTAITLSSSVNPSSVGKAVTFTFAVSPSPATGTVTFFDGSTTLGSGTLNNGTATFTTSSLSAGNHSIVATFGGSSATWTQTVKASTTTTVTSSANPSVLGQSLIFTAAVSPSGATGTVTFFDGSTTLGSGTLNNGTATFTTSSLSAGNHSIVATYNGDNTYGRSSATGTQTVIVKRSTTTTVTSSANPSVPGQSVIFTASVSSLTSVSISPLAPTGTVTFFDGTSTLGVGTLARGKALCGVDNSCVTSGLGAGSHSIKATYNGDSIYASSSGTVSQVVTVTASVTLASEKPRDGGWVCTESWPAPPFTGGLVSRL
jgi:uncharacterized protein (TIGR03437 family)